MKMILAALLFSVTAQAAVIHIDVEKYDDPSDFGVVFGVTIRKNLSVMGYRPFFSFRASRTPFIPLRGDFLRRTLWIDDGMVIEVTVSGQNTDAWYHLYIRDLNENVLMEMGPGSLLNTTHVVAAGLPSEPPAAYADWPTGVLGGLSDVYIDGEYWGYVADADDLMVDCDPLPLMLGPGTLLEVKGARTSEAHLYDTDMVLVDSSFVALPTDPDNYLSYLVPGDPGPDPESSRGGGGLCGSGVAAAALTAIVLVAVALGVRRKRP